MQTIVVTPPDGALLAAADVRAQLGLPSSVADATITAFVAAAADLLDGPPGWLGRSLGQQTLEARLERFPLGAERPIELDYPPIVSITSITYTDVLGGTQTLDPSLYQFDDVDTLCTAFGHAWPVARSGPGAVRVRYQAGYESGKVPASILRAIVLQVAAMNALHRDNAGMSQRTAVGLYSESWDNPENTDGVYNEAIMRLLSSKRIFK